MKLKKVYKCIVCSPAATYFEHEPNLRSHMLEVHGLLPKPQGDKDAES